MKTRIVSGLAMLPLLIFLYLGGYFIMGLCLIASIFAVWEFFKAFENATENAEISKPIRPSFTVSIISILLLYSMILAIDTVFVFIWTCFWLFITIALSFLIMFRHGRHTLTDVMITITGNVYIVFFFFHIVLITKFFSGYDSWISGFNNPAWLVILAAFGSDVFAYFTGVFLGKHKLCPNLSPKKTIEGLIGGIIGSTALCGLFAYFLLPDSLELKIHGFIIGAIGGGIATIGDLTASAIKRKLDIKDYSNLIPGHGGILDRFDSVLFTGPFVFYYLQILIFVRTLLA